MLIQTEFRKIIKRSKNRQANLCYNLINHMSTHQDAADLFDEILNMPSKHYDSGKTMGNKLGEEMAIKESQDFGLKSGSELADEIGYYQGISDVLENLISIFPSYEEKKESLIQNRIDKVLGELKNLLFPFEVQDPYDEQFNKKVTKIRSTFKILAALLKMKVSAKQDEI